MDCLEILGGFNFFLPYFNNTLDQNEGDLLFFHMPWPPEFFDLISRDVADPFTFAGDFSLDGFVVIETKRSRSFRRREVAVSAKYWKTNGFDGNAGASVHVDNNIPPVITSGKFQLGPPPPAIDANTIFDLFFPILP